jgi:D-glycero-D-manno-heptose 1,7-bisphosphate phosphatase
MKQPAAFLDRDDTIIRNIPYLTDPAGVELMPGAAAGLRLLHDANYQLVMVSNQSLIGRGLGTRADVDRVNDRMQALLREAGAALDAFYYCTHVPEDECDCRKPKPGLLQRAAEDLALDLTASLMFGDNDTDVQAGFAAGCRHAIRVGSEPFPTLLEAVRHTLASNS